MCGHVGEQLGRAARRGVTGVVLSASSRVVRVLRRLHGDEILHAALVRANSSATPSRSSDSETRTSLATSCCVSPSWRHRAVDVDPELGLAHDLREVHVHRAGDARDLARRSSARPRRRASSSPGAPTICTSMGAGRPKFRTWVEMSGARKKNVVSGYCSARRLRSSRT